MGEFQNKRVPRRNVTGEIANLAARLIAEDGTMSFAHAKQKAARQMGAPDQRSLPDNREIETALRAYLSIFQGDSQPQECRDLRQIAVEVMLWLNRFSPWLVGSVLSGTANRFSQIELEIIDEDTKRLELFFLNERMAFETRVTPGISAHHRTALNAISIYEILFNEFTIVIWCFPDQAARSAQRPRASLNHARARLKDVEALLT